jgi:hypothetical protein
MNDFILLGIVCHLFPNPNRYMETMENTTSEID